MDGSDVIGLSPQVEGLAEFIDWFGGWPTFHDAEVTRVELDRSAPSRIDVFTFELGDSIGIDGCLSMLKSVLVSFWLEQIQSLQIQDFNQQNVLSGLAFTKAPAGFELTLMPCFGLNGVVVARSVRISFTPVNFAKADGEVGGI